MLLCRRHFHAKFQHQDGVLRLVIHPLKQIQKQILKSVPENLIKRSDQLKRCDVSKTPLLQIQYLLTLITTLQNHLAT